MQRQFPDALREHRKFLLWKKVGNSFQLGHFDGADWVWNRSYIDRPKHTLVELLPVLEDDKGDAQGRPIYHVAFCPEGTGIAVIDFDYKKFAELAELNPDKADQIAKNRKTMDLWREQLAGYTYVEQSKTAGCYHALVEYPHARRSIEADAEGNEIKLPLDLLGAGFVVLTGDAQNAFDTQKPSDDDKAMIERYWDKATGDPAPIGQRWFGKGDKRRLVDVGVPPLYAVENATIDYVRERVVKLDVKYSWHLDGTGDYQPKSRAQERLNLMQATAFVTYGMPNAENLIWDVLANSYLATDYTPQTSNSNKTRFTNRAQVRWIKHEEIPLALGLAHETALEDRKQAVDFQPQMDRLAAGMAARRKTTTDKLDAASLAHVAALHDEEAAKPKTDLAVFPVKLMRDYEGWAAKSVYETERSMVRAATLSHLAAFVSRSYRTASNSCLNLYLILLAPQGSGKEVLSSAYATTAIGLGRPKAQYSVPASSVGFVKDMASAPDCLLIVKEFGDRFSDWQRKGASTHLMPTVLKDAYGVNAGQVYVGSAYSDSNNNIPDIPTPAPNVLGEGTRQKVLDAFSSHGIDDGFIGRFLLAECGTDWIDNEHDAQPDMPEPLLARLRKAIGNRSEMAGKPTLKVIPMSDDARALFKTLKDDEKAIKRAEGDHPHEGFWRAATQNAHKIASVLAVYAEKEELLVTAELAAWAIAYVRRSIAVGIGHMENDGAYSSVDRAAAKGLVTVIKRFFRAGAKGGTPSTRRNRELGRFSKGDLGVLPKAITDHPKGESLGRDIALKMLLDEDVISFGTEKGEDAQSKPYFRLGENWASVNNPQLTPACLIS